jgi:glycerol-3-phosphate dehydrogenase
LDEEWDLLVVGGGVTGAGILREATRAGLRALLVEQQDFGWGTSSRSSKLVHGGLRYLTEGKVMLTRTSVRERERLLRAASGLVEPLGFLLVTHEGDFPGRWTYQAGLSVYDLLALKWSHRRYDADEFRMLAPHVAHSRLNGGFRYKDAQTDDARLVLRVIFEALGEGGAALNYAGVTELVREAGRVVGAVVRDEPTGRQATVRARAVVNATGAWADDLRGQVGAPSRIRPLRGSHLVFPAWRFPIAQALGFLHPEDNRPVFVFPWEGVTLVGTTDLDHEAPLDEEPRISPEEVAYLMAGVQSEFPSLNLTLDDVVTTFAGVRPVVGSGKDDPSQESRDHVVWEESGLLTVTGGKMTTFRCIALDALKALRPRLPEMALDDGAPAFDPVEGALPEEAGGLSPRQRRRLLGRYGREASALVRGAQEGELMPIPGTKTLWAELRWGARAEGVAHLDDLILRRTRLGLLLPRGGMDLLPEVRELCQAELGWSDARWEAEVEAYRELWESSYSLPPRDAIPDWSEVVAQARARRAAEPSRLTKPLVAGAVVGALGLASLLTVLYWHKRSDDA